MRRLVAALVSLLAGSALSPVTARQRTVPHGPPTELPDWLPVIVSNPPTNFADFTTEGSSNHYWHQGRPYHSFTSWLAANQGAFSRASSATYVDTAGLIATAPPGVLRHTHDPITLASRGILIEGPRINWCLRSEQLDHFTWSAVAATVSANVAGAPDGNTTAETFVDTAAAGSEHALFQTVALGASTATAFSAYAKRGVSDYLALTYTGGADHYIAAVFDLSTGLVGETRIGSSSGKIVAATIEPGSLGFLRVSLVGSVAIANGLFVIGLATAATGNAFADIGTVRYTTAGGDHGACVWGAVAEVGNAPSSYIATTAGIAQRVADTLAFPIGVSPDPITAAVKGRTAPLADVQLLIHTDDSTPTEANDVELWRNTDAHMHFEVRAAKVVVADIDLGAFPDRTPFAAAYRAQANNYAACLNGGAVGTDTDGNMASKLNIVRFGVNGTIDRYWFGTIETVALFFGIAGSNADVQRLATR